MFKTIEKRSAKTPYRIHFDCEFIEDGKTIDLISIGLARSDGATLYLESNEVDLTRASPWVKENVIPKLQGGNYLVSRNMIAQKIIIFSGLKPEFWAYYGSYDWVCLCQLFGTMMDLPSDWPMFPMDLKQRLVTLGNPKIQIIQEPSTEHHALNDALWEQQVEVWLDSLERKPTE